MSRDEREKPDLKKGSESIDPTSYMEWYRKKTKRMPSLFLRQECKKEEDMEEESD